MLSLFSGAMNPDKNQWFFYFGWRQKYIIRGQLAVSAQAVNDAGNRCLLLTWVKTRNVDDCWVVAELNLQIGSAYFPIGHNFHYATWAIYF